MKRKFTFLTAAFTLLAFLAIPLGMWGQTRAEEVYSTCLFGPQYNSQSVSSYTATWTTTKVLKPGKPSFNIVVFRKPLVFAP